jgi:uncharacterized membrane protein
MDSIFVMFALIFMAALFCGIVLPIIAIVENRRTRSEFGKRINRLETLIQSPGGAVPLTHPAEEAAEEVAVRREEPVEHRVAPTPVIPSASPLEPPPPLRAIAPQPPPSAPVPAPPPEIAVEPPTAAEAVPPQAPHISPSPAFSFPRIPSLEGEELETVIGRRLLGWAAIVLILFGVSFFLKYAFENRWIGELGRVAIGVAAGVALSIAGLRYHRRDWRVFSQMLAAGGIMLLYLSTYGAFGFYHLIDQSAAFPFLVALVVEAAALAQLYNAPAIAMMALIGGFAVPILLRSDRDQYRVLFGYLTALDFGALALVRHWKGLNSIAYCGTHILFWIWYDSNYHPQKRLAVLVFQSAIFVLFLGAHLARQLFGQQRASIEDLALLCVNPFVFYATSYQLLDQDHHEWMGALAIVLAALYAGASRVMLWKRREQSNQLLLTIATALTFVTLAVPVQLRSNWITLAWAIEALLITRVAFEVDSIKLRVIGLAVLGLSLWRMVFWDTNLQDRVAFAPVLNRYFLSSISVALAVFATAQLFRKFVREKTRDAFALAMIGVASVWFVLTVETYTYFQAQANATRSSDAISHLLWLSRMSVSVLWSLYAAVLATVGLVRRSAGIRWAALGLFFVTMVKVVLVDMAELRQLYRITAFLVLGLVSLAVAWGYQRVFHVKEPSK